MSSSSSSPSLLRLAGLPYFVIAFIARLPFAMMVVGVLTVVVTVRGSLTLGGATSAAVGLGSAVIGPLLGAAADRFGQRPVLAVAAVLNAAALAAFTAVVYSPSGDVIVLLFAFLIGATAPQVSPMSRSRLVTIIDEQLPQRQRPRTLSATMSYESAADETVFVFGPFLVGLLASLIAPWAPLVIASALTLVFVGAFALHRTGAHLSATRQGGEVPSRVSELFRVRLLVVVVGIFGVGLFFGATLTALTSFMADRDAAEQAGLLYGVMGIGSAILALGVAWLPARFTLHARWLFFGAILLTGSVLFATATDTTQLIWALALLGTGVGPTLVTQFSLAAARSPLGRSATVMTMLGSGIIVGQSTAAALTGALAEDFGTSAVMMLPLAAAGIVVVSGIINRVLSPTQR